MFTVVAQTWTKDLAAKYDESVVTPCDYTLFAYIPKGISEHFREDHYDPDSTDSFGCQLRQHLIEDMRAILTEDDRITVARMDLVFDNNHMIELIKERGAAIMNDASPEELKKIHDKIEKLKSK